jgi:DinB superfamily
LVNEIDESKISVKPNTTEHSLLELLWHMNTWAEFTLAHLENRSADELTAIEQNDWRTINPEKHNWKKVMEQLKSIHEKIIVILKQKEDVFLKEPVPGREFNFRFMLNGLIQHNIYHAGQIAYIKNLLKT